MQIPLRRRRYIAQPKGCVTRRCRRVDATLGQRAKGQVIPKGLHRDWAMRYAMDATTSWQPVLSFGVPRVALLLVALAGADPWALRYNPVRGTEKALTQLALHYLQTSGRREGWRLEEKRSRVPAGMLWAWNVSLQRVARTGAEPPARRSPGRTNLRTNVRDRHLSVSTFFRRLPEQAADLLICRKTGC